MAKVNAPLFSFKASGKLANALVYFGWKGLNVVRSYVVPTNPDTTAQSLWRAKLRACVAKIHTAQARATFALGSEDQVAYAALGSTRPTPRTWFNEICKLWLDCEVLDDIPCIYSGVDWADLDVTAFEMSLALNEKTASELLNGKFYFGTTKTNMIHSVAHNLTAGVKVDTGANDLSAFLTAGKKYFVQYKPDVDDPCEGANSGIYYFVAE